jgi:hypothetical protein
MTDKERRLLLEVSQAIAGLCRAQSLVRMHHPAGSMLFSGHDASERIIQAAQDVILERPQAVAANA